MSEILNEQERERIIQAYCWTAEIEQRAIINMYSAKDSPFLHMRGKLYMDGDKWCALYGDNLQEGLCGFGDSPCAAQADFDTNYYKNISK